MRNKTVFVTGKDKWRDWGREEKRERGTKTRVCEFRLLSRGCLLPASGATPVLQTFEVFQEHRTAL